jgi:hypothetical protein
MLDNKLNLLSFHISSHGHLEEISHADLLDIIQNVLVVLQIASFVILVVSRASIRL